VTNREFCKAHEKHSGHSDRELLYIILKSQENLMSAIDTLNANVAKLSTDVDALLAKPAGVPEAAVQTAADAVAAIDAKVTAVLPAP
jgi:outer membrane murein-binding lipoprotein Lpp